MSLYTRIAGTGSYLPERRVSNDELAQMLAERKIETSDAWITERTGIRARRFADEGVLTSDLAVRAAQAALQMANRQASEVDLIILATSTPDMIFPSTATVVQQKLGIHGCPAFDVQAVCSGFIYALTVADAMIRTGAYRCALVIGAEVFSRILDFNDRRTCVLFGDGAGAVVLEPSQEPGILASELHADGQHRDLLCTTGRIDRGEILGHPFIEMNGQAVFKHAVHLLHDVAKSALEKAGKKDTDVNWFIPHQANLRIMLSTSKRLGVSEDRMIVTVDEHGNTSAASIPLALDVGVRDGRVKRGDLLVFEGIGGGFTWGAVVLNY